MGRVAKICRLPGPVVAVIQHDDGLVSFEFTATIYQAERAAYRAGAEMVSMANWDDLGLTQLEDEAPSGKVRASF